MYFMLSPVFCAIGFALYFVVFALTGYVSLGSISIYLYIFFGTVICGQNGILFHMTQPHLNEMYLIIGLLTAMAVWEHRGNISRLLHGTEGQRRLSAQRLRPRLVPEPETVRRSGAAPP